MCQNLFSCKILYLHKFFLPITTPKSNPSTYYKHFRKAVAFAFRKLELCRHCRFRAGSFSGLSSRIRVLAQCHVDRHGHFTLKQLRLPVVNETHTKSYTGPRLLTKIWTSHTLGIYLYFKDFLCMGNYMQPGITNRYWIIQIHYWIIKKGLRLFTPLGGIFRAEQNFSLSFLISSTREITR
jgi:hypothetical protein